MQYKITGVVLKSNDWKLVDAIDMSGVEIQQASANRVDKKGNIWAAFDSIVEGGSVEADFWRSDAGKPYLFAPKPTKSPTGANRGQSGANIAKAQERKQEGINKSMDRKEMAILVSAAMRDATQITLASLKNEPFPTDADFGREFRKYRDWYIQQWKLTEQTLDVPFEKAPKDDFYDFGDGPGKGENGDWSNQD